MANMFLGSQSATTIRPVLITERTVYYREKAAGMYSALPYALAQVFTLQICLYICFCLWNYVKPLVTKNSCYLYIYICHYQIVIEIPYTLVQAIIYGVIVYAMIGDQWTAKKLFQNIFFLFSTLLYYIYYGMMLLAMSPNQESAAIVSGVFQAMWNLFAGFVIPRNVSSKTTSKSVRYCNMLFKRNKKMLQSHL